MSEEVGTLAEALYDFDGVREDNVTFKKGEILIIIEMDPSGWWKASNAKGAVGIFPYNYCQLRLSPEANFPFVKAIADYNGQTDEDLSFAAGDLITVIREITKEWSEGKTIDGRRGRFPTNFAEPTGEFDEQTLKEETEKWEKIEAQKLAEAEARQKEREAAEKKLREEEERKEAERLKREAEEEKERLRSEARAAKRHAEKLANEKAEKEAELLKQQLILKKQLEQAEMEKKQYELKLAKQAAEAKHRAEEAERQLELARAEAALLHKKQEAADARKSKVVFAKIQSEKQAIQRKALAAAKNNDGHAPGPPPRLAQVKIPEIEEEQENEVKQEVVVEEKPAEEPKKKKGQNKKLLGVSYLEKEEAPPEQEKPEEEEKRETGSVVRRRRKRQGKPVNPKFAHLGGGSKCAACGESVGIGDQVKALSKVWHTQCFTCATCSKVLRAGDYRDHDGVGYCIPCHNKGFGIGGYGYGIGAGILQPKTQGGGGARGTVETTSVFSSNK